MRFIVVHCCQWKYRGTTVQDQKMFVVRASNLNIATMKRYAVRVIPVIGAVAATFYIATLAYLQVLGQLRMRESNVRVDSDHAVKNERTLYAGSAFTHETRRVLENHDYRDNGASLSKSMIVETRACQERTNFVFIKCMKCATETMGTLLRRYGYMRNLSFVIPVDKNIYLGWPYKMTKSDYRKNKTRQLNILIEHSIYDRAFMTSMMSSDTAYITMIREPYSHFQSVFYYFNVVNIAKVLSPDPISEYLRKIHSYDAFYRTHEAAPLRYCIPDNFSITKNLQSHCLGMPLGFPPASSNITGNTTAIQSYIERLDRDFTLVMLVEYFFESLVLLKRLMCWSTRDIIHHTVNILNYADKTQPAPLANVKIYQRWSHVDYILYDHFYKVFWRKVRQQTPDFFDEVKQFRQTQGHVMYYCYKTKDSNDLVVPQTKWNVEFNFTRYECDLMDSYLLDKIKSRYDDM